MIKAKVENLNFTVELVDEFENDELLGITLYASATIKLLKILSPENLKSVLIHELTHAFMYANGFKSVESLNCETVCDFIGCHGEKIINLANQIMKELKHE